MPASTLRRSSSTATAFGDSVTGALPDGPPRHFCSPALTASIPQASTSSGLPPTVAVASV
ncbi:hypothetical protein Q9Q99_07515 [Curtobacterium flaccumfaciens]|nr:hypothetical protein Q9Q99_07515 [Curtobacterium flaccumfaciens]